MQAGATTTSKVTAADVPTLPAASDCRACAVQVPAASAAPEPTDHRPCEVVAESVRAAVVPVVRPA